MAGSEIIAAVEHILTYVILAGVICFLANALRKKSIFLVEKDGEGRVQQISQLTDKIAEIEAERRQHHPAEIISIDPATRSGPTPPSMDEEIDNLGDRGPGGD